MGFGVVYKLSHNQPVLNEVGKLATRYSELTKHTNLQCVIHPEENVKPHPNEIFLGKITIRIRRQWAVNEGTIWMGENSPERKIQ